MQVSPSSRLGKTGQRVLPAESAPPRQCCQAAEEAAATRDRFPPP